MGDLLRPLDCGSETWMGDGSHHGQLCGGGQGGFISELCFLISKMTITVFVLLTKLGGAKVAQCVKEAI